MIYAGMGESTIRGDVSPGDGVYRSTDGGLNWEDRHAINDFWDTVGTSITSFCCLQVRLHESIGIMHTSKVCNQTVPRLTACRGFFWIHVAYACTMLQ